MSLDYVRQIVSGNKARFIDSETAVDLDLVYVTDRIIIMGYPATGFAALYRNRRRDVLRFINSRHGEKWWIWNLCPLYENAYSPESMHNRVSRYPFPDHHPPPLPLLPLAVREMTAWIEGDKERVAIIHCKAGKGRSGTLLCSYLLSLKDLPPVPQLERSYSAKDRTQQSNLLVPAKDLPKEVSDSGDERDGWVVLGHGDEVDGVQLGTGSPDTHSGAATPARSERIAVSSSDNVSRSTTSSTTTLSRPSPPPSVQIDIQSEPPYEPIDVGDEGSIATQGQQDRRDGRVDEVFKLHSSRRMKPTSTGRGVSIPSQRRWCRYIHLLFNNQAPKAYLDPRSSRIRILSITILMHPPSKWQKPINALAGAGLDGEGKAWASIARYDDDYVEELKRRGGTGEGVDGEITWGGVGGDGKYDTNKMFRTCGKVVDTPFPKDLESSIASDSKDLHVHHLEPSAIKGSDSRVVLDRCREFRMKLHLASLPLGWAWLIPAFHIPEPSGPSRTHTLRFPRSQIDFAIGPGHAIDSVILRLQDVPDAEATDVARVLSPGEEKAEGLEDQRGERVKEDGD